MANNDGNGQRPGFDPHSAPTIIEQAPFRGAEVPPPQYEPPAAFAEPTTPKGVGDLLGEALNLYKKNFVAFLLVAAVGMGPVAVLAGGIGALGAGLTSTSASSMQVDTDRLKEIGQEMQEAAAQQDQAKMQALAREQKALALGTMRKSVGLLARLGGMLLLAILIVPLWALAFFFTQAALTALAVDRAREGSMTWQGAWGAVLGRLGGLLGTSLLVAIGIGVGTLLCLLPGIAFAFIACFAILAVFLEKKGGVDAITRSFELVKADPLRTFLVLLVYGVLSFVARVVLGIVVPGRFYFMHSVVGAIGSIAIAPFGLVALTLLYQDIRRTKLNESPDDIRAQENELLSGS